MRPDFELIVAARTASAALNRLVNACTRERKGVDDQARTRVDVDQAITRLEDALGMCKKWKAKQ